MLLFLLSDTIGAQLGRLKVNPYSEVAMGSCVYCGEPAGLFRKKHDKCDARYQDGRSLLIEQVVAALAKAVEVVSYVFVARLALDPRHRCSPTMGRKHNC